MNLILFENTVSRNNLKPFSLTRPIADLRLGIFTIREKWEHTLLVKASSLTEEYLSKKYTCKITDDNLLVFGGLIPSDVLRDKLMVLQKGEYLTFQQKVIAARVGKFDTKDSVEEVLQKANYEVHVNFQCTVISQNWHLFQQNGAQIRQDFDWIKKKGGTNFGINDVHTRVYKSEDIFVEEGVKIRAAVLNAENGPIYLGKNSEIQEGAVIRGPFSLGEGSTVNMGAKIRGDVTIGPYCKVGGEVSNSIFYAYSNKGHDGFLGNSVIGEWCNIGADSNTSNLKNNYSEIKVWNYEQQDYTNTGLIFCGLMMGDHSKCGINTMFNTGSVVGVNANIFGGHFPPKFIPSFAWGGDEASPKYDFEKAIEVAQRVMERRNLILSDSDISILTWIYQNSN